MPLGFFFTDVFELALQVAQLKLSDNEYSLFNALLIMNPDRGDLQDKDHIEELQATLLHVLFKHLKYYRPGWLYFTLRLNFHIFINFLFYRWNRDLFQASQTHSTGTRNKSKALGGSERHQNETTDHSVLFVHYRYIYKRIQYIQRQETNTNIKQAKKFKLINCIFSTTAAACPTHDQIK